MLTWIGNKLSAAWTALKRAIVRIFVVGGPGEE